MLEKLRTLSERHECEGERTGERTSGEHTLLLAWVVTREYALRVNIYSFVVSHLANGCHGSHTCAYV